MGGRGASSGGGGGGSGVKTVPFDKWGKDIDEPILDKDGNTIGYITDETRWVTEPDIRPVTKKEVIKEIADYRNDDGTYGDEDTSILVAYKDGTVVSADELDGKPFKKSGIVGASVSTGDYEMVWGGEVGRDGQIRPWQTWSEDGESGRSNSYSGYKTVGAYKVRVKTIYNNPKQRGGYYTTRETIRKSTVKPIDSI